MSIGKIVYPSHSSEFEIQSFVYQSLMSLGHDVRGEVRTTNGKSRFDLVVFVDKHPVLIIEIKKFTAEESQLRSPKKGRATRVRKQLRTRVVQDKKYREYELPVSWIEGMQQAVSYVESAKVNGINVSHDGHRSI